MIRITTGNSSNNNNINSIRIQRNILFLMLVVFFLHDQFYENKDYFNLASSNEAASTTQNKTTTTSLCYVDYYVCSFLQNTERERERFSVFFVLETKIRLWLFASLYCYEDKTLFL